MPETLQFAGHAWRAELESESHGSLRTFVHLHPCTWYATIRYGALHVSISLRGPSQPTCIAGKSRRTEKLRRPSVTVRSGLVSLFIIHSLSRWPTHLTGFQ